MYSSFIFGALFATSFSVATPIEREDSRLAIDGYRPASSIHREDPLFFAFVDRDDSWPPAPAETNALTATIDTAEWPVSATTPAPTWAPTAALMTISFPPTISSVEKRPTLLSMPVPTFNSAPLLPVASARPAHTAKRPVTPELTVAAWALGSIALCALLLALAANTTTCTRKTPRRAQGHNTLASGWLAARGRRASAVAPRPGPAMREKLLDDRVLDITKNFPGSKFSVTSSDYAISCGSLSSPNFYPAPYAPAAELYGPAMADCQPRAPLDVSSVSTIASVESGVGHARTRSAPFPRYGRAELMKSAAISEWDIARSYGAPRLEKAKSVGMLPT